MKQIKQLILFFILSFPGIILAEDNITFEAFVDAKQVVLNSYFEVSFTLKNADGGSFNPPDFKYFQVLSGPNRSSSTTIINGQVSREIGLNYTLKPTQVGTFTIKPASIKVGGKVLRTNPLRIEVVEGKSGGEDGAEQIIVKAIPNVEEARVGQQIILDYKLYTTIDIDSYNVIEEADYAGFFAKDIKRYNFRVVKEVINGVQYTTKIIKRVALYPQQAGLLTVEPMFLQMGIVKDGNRNRISSFFRQVERVPIQTEAIEIQVNPLPSNPPASFTGAVGQYKVNTTLNRTTVTTDDVISLRMAISGNGDIKRVQAPKMAFPDDFEVYDPKVLDESSYESGDDIIGKKVIEYLLVPKNPGNFNLQPEFTYYDPDSSKYVTLKEDIYRLTVRQGSARPKAPILTEEDAEAKEDIRFIKLEAKLKPKGDTFFASIGFWVLAILPFLFLGGAVLARQRQNKISSLDPSILKARKARKVAQKRLATAESFLKANDSRAFYDEISKAMLGYVCDKLQIPLSELTKDNVREKLESLQVGQESISNFMGIIQTTEMALFAGKDNAAAMQEVYDTTINLLSGIEQDLS
jgi:hypothetical protein